MTIGHIEQFNCLSALLNDVLDAVREGAAGVAKLNLFWVAFKAATVSEVKCRNVNDLVNWEHNL